jgi:hypothetical protein
VENHCSQLLNVQGVNNVGQTEMHTAEHQLPFETEMATEKVKRHKLPGTDQIPAELIIAGASTLLL